MKGQVNRDVESSTPRFVSVPEIRVAWSGKNTEGPGGKPDIRPDRLSLVDTLQFIDKMRVEAD